MDSFARRNWQSRCQSERRTGHSRCSTKLLLGHWRTARQRTGNAAAWPTGQRKGRLANPSTGQARLDVRHHLRMSVPAVALATHAARQAMTAQQGTVGFAGVLTATVGMHDQARRRLALRNGHLQGRAHQFGRHVRRHGPADNFARVQIQHRRQVQPAICFVSPSPFIRMPPQTKSTIPCSSM